MATIASLVVTVAADVSNINRNLDKIQGQFNKVEKLAGTMGKALAGAFTITAIVGATKQVLDFAGKLTDLHAKTGLSTTALQKLQLTFEQSGVSLDTVTRAATELGARLVGDKGAVSLLDKLGLSAAALKRMKPEDQFLTVADRIGQIQNKAEQLYASKTLFGRSGVELLAGLTGNLKETAAEFERMGLIMDEQTVAAADEFGDKLGLMGKQLLAIVASIVGPLLPALSALGTAFLWLGQNVLGPVLTVAIKGVITALALLWGAIAEVLAKLADLAQRVPIVGKHLGFLAGAAEWLRDSSKSSFEHVKNLWVQTDKVGESAAAAGPKLLGLGEDIKTASEEAIAAAQATSRLAVFYKDALHMMDSVNADVMGRISARNDEALRKQFDQMLRLKQFQDSIISGTFTAAPATQFMGQGNVTEMRRDGTLGSSMRQSIGGAFMDLPNVIMSTLQGGGSLGKSIGGLFGTSIGEGITGKLIGKMSETFLKGGLGKLASGALSAVLPGVGGILGSMVSGLFGKLFGGGEQKKIQEMLGKFAEQFGGLDSLKTAAGEAGVSLDKLFSAKKVRDFEAAQRDVIAGLEQYKDRMDAIASLTDAQTKRQKMLTDAVERYGFTIEQLGPTLRNQKLAEQAEELLTDFQLLTESGIDSNLVITKMADSINKFVHIAMKTGVEIPESMRPMLQRMVDLGLLTDESGRKLDSLKDLTFGKKLEDMFTGVLKKLDELILKLTEIVDGSKQIPNNPFANWAVPVPPSTTPPGRDDGGPPRGGFAFGTGGRYLDFGAGTNVRLHGRERVMTEAEGRGEGGAMAQMAKEIAGLRRDVRRSDMRWEVMIGPLLTGAR